MDARQVGRPHDTGIVHQFGHHETWLRVIPARWQVSEVRLSNGVEQQITSHRDSPSEDEELGVEHGAQACTGLAKPGAELTQGVAGAGVTVDQKPRDDLTGEPASTLPLGREV